MSIIVRNLTLDQKANAEFQINVYDINGANVDLTGYSANVGMRKHFGSANAYYFDTTGYSNGLLVISMDAANTAALDSDRYAYEVKLVHTSSNTTQIIQEGLMLVKPGI